MAKRKPGDEQPRPKGFPCSRCKAPSGQETRLPRGWKRDAQERPFCKTCWVAAYERACITFPIASPLDGTWEELWSACHPLWRETTNLANYCVSELHAHALRLRFGKGRKPKTPYLYGQLKERRLFQNLPSQARIAVINSVERKYRKVATAVAWSFEESVPNHRYPVPFPLDADGWNPSFEEHVGTDGHKSKQPIVSITLPAFDAKGKCTGTRRFRLRLRGGQDFKRQLASFKRIVADPTLRGELAIYRRGSKLSGVHLMVKMAAWLPRRPAGERVVAALVRTDPNALWVCEIDGRGPWILNADNARIRQAAHRVFLQRIAEDTKFEKRWPAHVRRQKNEYREMRCKRYRDWLDSFVKESAACLAKFLERQKVAQVLYQDSTRDHLPDGPWYDLEKRLKTLCDARLIVFTTGTPEEESASA